MSGRGRAARRRRPELVAAERSDAGAERAAGAARRDGLRRPACRPADRTDVTNSVRDGARCKWVHAEARRTRRNGVHLWTPPSDASGFWRAWHVVGCCHLSGLLMQRWGCGPAWEFADRIQITRACSTHGEHSWFFRPRLADCCAMPSFARLRLRRPRARSLPSGGCGRSLVDTALGEQRPDDPRRLVGQRDGDQHARLPRQHLGQPRPLRGAALAGLAHDGAAPMISSRLSVRSPILVMPPSRCLPPVDRCRGVRPSQAAKSRPLRKVCGRRRQRQHRGGGDRADAGDRSSAAGPSSILLAPAGDLAIEAADPRVQRSDRRRSSPGTRRVPPPGSAQAGSSMSRHQPRHPEPAPGRHPAILGEQTAQAR